MPPPPPKMQVQDQTKKNEEAKALLNKITEDVNKFDKELDERISSLPFKLDLSKFMRFEENKYISLSTKIHVLEEYFTRELEKYEKLGLISN